MAQPAHAGRTSHRQRRSRRRWRAHPHSADYSGKGLPSAEGQLAELVPILTAFDVEALAKKLAVSAPYTARTDRGARRSLAAGGQGVGSYVTIPTTRPFLSLPIGPIIVMKRFTFS
jgi:hypothetical protein